MMGYIRFVWRSSTFNAVYASVLQFLRLLEFVIIVKYHLPFCAAQIWKMTQHGRLMNETKTLIIMTGNTVFSGQGHHSKGSRLLVFDIISWGKLYLVSYSGGIRGSRLHITFTHHRFQGCSVQVFLSGRNEFVYWAKVGHATRTCWKQ